MINLLGLVVAGCWGTANLFGAIGGRDVGARLTNFVYQATNMVVIFFVALAVSGDLEGRSLALGAAAGLTGAVGLNLLFSSMAKGATGVVLPVGTATSSSIVVVGGLVLGERFGLLGWVGIALALVAVVLLSGGDSEEAKDSRAGVLDAFGSGLLMGITLIVLSQTSEDAGSWPLVPYRAVMVALVGGTLLIKRPGRMPEGWKAWAPLALNGVFSALGDALWLFAVQRGSFALVSVLATLFPAVTAGLAATFLHERLSRRPLTGMVVALAGASAIAVR